MIEFYNFLGFLITNIVNNSNVVSKKGNDEKERSTL